MRLMKITRKFILLLTFNMTLMLAMSCVVMCSVVYWSMVVVGDGGQGQGQWS